MAEGDTIHRVARRIGAVLEGRVPDEIRTPQPRHARDRWPERLAGRALERAEARGKHLLLHFAGGLALHSHLRMTGSWRVVERGGRWPRSPRRAWLVMRAGDHEVVEFDGPVLELMTEWRLRTDPRLARLGPDILAAGFDPDAVLARLRGDDPTRGIGDAVLDQRTVAGLGNVWKSEACWDAEIDPWRPAGEVADEQVRALLAAARSRMAAAAAEGGHDRDERVYGRAGRPCPRCGTRILAAGQGAGNRTTYWCPGCQR